IATGATLAGIAGTFLAVPVTAMVVAVAGALRAPEPDPEADPEADPKPDSELKDAPPTGEDHPPAAASAP
ncbi:MAG: hypothetical protein WKF86_08575, partial [Acidimicrobiales bacterium]